MSYDEDYQRRISELKYIQMQSMLQTFVRSVDNQKSEYTV
jgi:hypothetical protein